ncbi:MAG: c-type cytochrome [Candidatus Obscuribacterales bacterium]|nr:c-type cytochrome [Candidatus Obscuribacterales bacterium]
MLNKTLSLKTLSLLVALPAALTISACTQKVEIEGADDKLVSRQVTEADNVVIFPDDNPSIPDGKEVYTKMECATCHGADGKGIANKTTVDLSNEVMVHKQKPLDLYYFLTYGRQMAEGSAIAQGHEVNHPAMKNSLTRKEVWDLVFYTRSIAVPPLAQKEIDDMDAVFGANCAVCHGKRGHGDGPLNKNFALEPTPANFHQYNRFFDRTDDVLWDHIANGIKWEGMPNFLNKQDRAKNIKFDEAYIKKLVQFVRHFHSSDQATVAVGLNVPASQMNPAPDKK